MTALDDEEKKKQEAAARAQQIAAAKAAKRAAVQNSGKTAQQLNSESEQAKLIAQRKTGVSTEQATANYNAKVNAQKEKTAAQQAAAYKEADLPGGNNSTKSYRAQIADSVSSGAQKTEQIIIANAQKEAQQKKAAEQAAIEQKKKLLSGKKEGTKIYADTKNQIANLESRAVKLDAIIQKCDSRAFVKNLKIETLQNQIDTGEILRNKQIPKRNDYFHHYQEFTGEYEEILKIFSNDQRISPEVTGISANTKPRTIWAGIAQKRSNVHAYTEDAVTSLFKYSETAETLLAYDPLIAHFREANSAIRSAAAIAENEKKGSGANAGSFVSWADKWTNSIAGKSYGLDRYLAESGDSGRAVLKALKRLNNRVKANAILGNIRSALTQIGNIPNAASYIPNPNDWKNGAELLTKALAGDESVIEAAEARKQSGFMSSRYLDDSIRKLTKEIQKENILEKPEKASIWMLGAGDRAAAELIWYTAYAQYYTNPAATEKMGRSYKNAVDYADDITQRSVAGRGRGETALAETSQIVGLVAPFQVEVNNSYQNLKEQIGKKNASGIIALEITTYLLNGLLEAAFGDRPLGFDFISAIADTIKQAINGGDDDEEDEGFLKDTLDVLGYGVGRAAGETLSSMPFGTQIASALTGGDEDFSKKFFGDSDPTRFGTGNIGISAVKDVGNLIYDTANGKETDFMDWLDVIAPVALPYGGKQLSRTARGIEQIVKGGNYGTDKNGNEFLKYPQGEKPEDYLKSLLFGPYSTSYGQDYIENGFKGLNAEETKKMKTVEAAGIDGEDYYNYLLGIKKNKLSKNEEKREALFTNDDFTARQKSIIDFVLFGTTEKTDEETGNKVYEVKDKYTPRDYSDKGAFNYSGFDENKQKAIDSGIAPETWDSVAEGLKAIKAKEFKDANGETLDGMKGIAAAEYLNSQSLTDEQKAQIFEAAGYKGNYWGTDLDSSIIISADRMNTEFKDLSQEQKIKNIQTAFGITDYEAYEAVARARGSWKESRENLNENQGSRLDNLLSNTDWTEKEYFEEVNNLAMKDFSTKAKIISELKLRGFSEKEATEFWNYIEGTSEKYAPGYEATAADETSTVAGNNYYGSGSSVKYGLKKEEQVIKCSYLAETYGESLGMSEADFAEMYVEARNSPSDKKEDRRKTLIAAGYAPQLVTDFLQVYYGQSSNYKNWKNSK